ncbi:MAG: GspE/PulE/PilB domain-containing protein [Planctomycetota bacterium]|jgi:hypothetical protein
MAIDRRQNKRLSEVLSNEGILTKTQIQEAEKYLRQPEDPLGPHLIRCGFITSWDLAKCVCTHFTLPFFDLSSFKPNQEVVELLEPAFMHGYGILPLDRFGKILTLAVMEALSPEVLQSIVDKTELSPYMYVAPFDAIRSQLEEHAPYDAPEGADMPAATGGDEDDGGDWMSIFEEAEKNLTGAEEEEGDGGGDEEAPAEEEEKAEEAS